MRPTPTTRILRPVLALTGAGLALACLVLLAAPASADTGHPAHETAARESAAQESVAQESAAGETAQQPAPEVSFLGVTGVDLSRLGYAGPDIGSFAVTDLDAPLPKKFAARGRDLGRRLDRLNPERNGLATVVPLLDAAERAVVPRIRRQRHRIELATTRAGLAEDRLDEARARVARRRRELATQQKRVTESVVAAYVHPPEADTLGGVLDGVATNAEELAAPVLRKATIDHQLELRDRLRVSLAAATVEAVDRADRAIELASARREAGKQLAHLQHRRASLAVARKRARARRQAIEARVQWIHNELDAMAHTLFNTRSGTPAWGRQLGDVPVRNVGGITVHVAVSHRLESLLAAARADGIVLKGWGYRSHQRQIELRRAHCGTSHEDVWQKPSGRCSPPTAVPGRSMHELGLAVDFTWDGQGITSRRSPAYRWLASHAWLYGFANLPSEPWHWSLTGR